MEVMGGDWADAYLMKAYASIELCLVEQGKLDEAEAIYRKALEANPKDQKSQGELRYIEGLRKK